MKKKSDLNIGFFGTGPLAEECLSTLIGDGLIPKLVITKPDSMVGRNKTLTPPTIKIIAQYFNIKVYQPESLKKDILNSNCPLVTDHFDIFIVASYGNIIPNEIIEIPTFGTINIHPSLLPKYRGPTPIESALLFGEKEFGISIMFLDEKVDHGPILAQKKFTDFMDMPDATSEVFERLAGIYGAKILGNDVLEKFVQGALQVTNQDHTAATYTKKFLKTDGEVKITDEMSRILKVYRACTPWPGCYFMHSHGNKLLRIKISEMKVLEDGTINIEKVIPEGKSEISFESFKNGYMKKIDNIS